MRDALYTVMIWPVDHLWQSLLLAIPGGFVTKYGWHATLSGLGRAGSSRR